MGSWTEYLSRIKMKTNPGIVVVSLLSLVAAELAPRYIPIVPNALSGQGYNPGGYNPGNSLVAFTASQADFCCLRRGKLVFQKSLTNLRLLLVRAELQQQPSPAGADA